jgi:hypothetical protein
VLAVAALALAGCTQNVPGSQTTGSSGSGGQPTSASSPSGGAPGGKSLASVDPCTLLTSGEVAQLGLPAGQKENLGGARGCTWNVPSGNGYSLGVGIRDAQGIKDLVTEGGRLSKISVGKHDARRLEEQGKTPGSCMITLGVTSSSRVDVQVNADTTTQACQIADNVVTNVEPKLP